NANRKDLDVPVTAICCYPTDWGFITAVTNLLGDALTAAKHMPNDIRILFSAHGLPKKIISDGDPYQWQVE
ncbi:MAG TPA: ferrochelatase, partial [Rhodospirillaceae bacterium]|nr:ferrochelatase [Rhodospirillaceae bacterium]